MYTWLEESIEVQFRTIDGLSIRGVHQWLPQTNHEQRLQWIASIEQVEALEPGILVAGHKQPEARDDVPMPGSPGTPRLRGGDQRRFERGALPLRLRWGRGHKAPHQAPDLPADT